MRVAKKKVSVGFTAVRLMGLLNLRIAPAKGETLWLGLLGVPSSLGNGAGENAMKLRGSSRTSLPVSSSTREEVNSATRIARAAFCTSQASLS